MVFDTGQWLRSTVISYRRGIPHLLQYELSEEEIITLAQLVDALTAARIEEAMNNRGDE